MSERYSWSVKILTRNLPAFVDIDLHIEKHTIPDKHNALRLS